MEEIKLTALRHEITTGVQDLIHGRFQTCNDANFRQQVEDVRRYGKIGVKTKANVRQKKV